MLSVVMLTGLLQQKNSNFEGVMERKFVAVGFDSPQIDGEKYFAQEIEDT